MYLQCTVSTLQKLCDILSEHQSWTIAHLIAHFGLYEHLTHAAVKKHINEIDPITGATPLMVSQTTYSHWTKCFKRSMCFYIALLIILVLIYTWFHAKYNVKCFFYWFRRLMIVWPVCPMVSGYCHSWSSGMPGGHSQAPARS